MAAARLGGGWDQRRAGRSAHGRRILLCPCQAQHCRLQLPVLQPSLAVLHVQQPDPFHLPSIKCLRGYPGCSSSIWASAVKGA